MPSLLQLVPSLGDISGAFCVFVVSVLLTGAGRLLFPKALPEFNLLAGWGLLCLVLTFWGCLLSIDLRWPLLIMGFAGIAGWLRSTEDACADWKGLWCVGVLSLPIWVLMLPVRAAEVDTWLNLLPNAAYLVDHNMLPRADRPESYSFLPVAPYNTQFIAYAASVLRGSLIDNAIGLFNILLQCVAGSLLARILAGEDRRIGWGQAACGLLLALPLNPGLVPKIYFADYGEAAIDVTVFAAILIGAMLLRPTEGQRNRLPPLMLGLVLAALVNVKQQAIGLFGGYLLAYAVAGLNSDRPRLLRSFASASLPGIALYGIWRWYASSAFVVGELKPLPMSAWNTHLIPQILAATLHAALQRGVYFVALITALVGTIIVLRRRFAGWSQPAAMMILVTVLADIAFIEFSYVAHFPASWAIEAHSFFRYMSEVSLIVMLGLVLWLLHSIRLWLGHRDERLRRRLTVMGIIVILIAPLGFIRYLRFDLDPPQPQIAKMVQTLKPFLHVEDKLALIIPGDSADGIGSSYLRGLILYERPRILPADVKILDRYPTAGLDALATQGYRQILVSCSDLLPSSLAPRHAMVLLRVEPDGWMPSIAISYPHSLDKAHFTALLPRTPFCG